ncbi:MAG: hypothetical protein VB106_10345 [Clostridiaceae bacterium]|jgi:hypothetical protein|nr:hypothetical protein [Clostridiaceae bacterium]
MDRDLIVVLEDVNKKIGKVYSGKKKEKYEKLISGLINQYNNLEIPEEHMEIYNSLVKRGKELMNPANIKEEKKVEFYLGYCRAAIYDFNNNIAPLKNVMKAFILTAMMFFVLSPQYFSFVLPLVFIIPVFMGYRGIKNRVFNGLLIGLAVVPMGILVAFVWIRNAILTLSTGTFADFISGLAQTYGVSFEFSRNLAMACIFMSVVLLASSISFVYFAVKHRNMFI